MGTCWRSGAGAAAPASPACAALRGPVGALPAAQRRLERGLQGLVPHRRRAALRSIDDAGPGEPLYRPRGGGRGHGQRARVAGVRCGVARARAAQDGTLRQRTTVRLDGSGRTLGAGGAADQGGRNPGADRAGEPAAERAAGAAAPDPHAGDGHPPAASLAAQARRFARFWRVYNEERPHEALGMAVPASLYAASRRRWSGRLHSPEYASGVAVKRVRTNGEIKWRGELVYISSALVGSRSASRRLRRAFGGCGSGRSCSARSMPTAACGGHAPLALRALWGSPHERRAPRTDRELCYPSCRIELLPIIPVAQGHDLRPRTLREPRPVPSMARS